MDTYESYQDYKNSQNNWIGNVPTHWNIQRADFLTQTNRRQVSAESLDGVELIHYSIPNVQAFGTGKLESGDQIDSAKLLISEQQLLVSKLNPRKSTLCIAVPNDQYTVVASSEFVPLLAGQTHLEYSYYVWGSDKVTKLLSSMVQSVTRSHQRVNPSNILKIYWAWPPLHEQKAIARFLDHKTAQIDALIAKKQALLEKLAEQRTALISQAVTKGLDPSVPMKDSGVEWLGEIPAHWNAIRVRHISEFVTSGSRGWAQYYSNDGNVFLRITNVSRHSVDLLRNDIQRVSPPRGAEGDRTKTSSGDIVVSITADLGSVAVIPEGYEEAYVSQHLALIRPQKGRVYPRWLAYQVFSQHGKAQLTGAGYGGTKIQLSLPDIKDLWISLPPLDVQKNICTAIDAKVEKLEFQCSKVHKIIEKLHEYRAALITNAVTGKIDVRDFCPNTTTEQKELAHG